MAFHQTFAIIAKGIAKCRHPRRSRAALQCGL